MHPVEDYLTRIQSIYATGAATEETSYYGALEALFNKVGQTLKPKVRCVPQLASQGSGHPDFGLYAESQMQHTQAGEVPLQTFPERGVVEVKSWKEDAFVTAEASQVSKYWQLYRLVLVTNFRDFIIIGCDATGKPLRLESFRLADHADHFVQYLKKPLETAQRLGDRFLDFLRRALQQAAPLSRPADLAWFLASYAREAKARLEAAGNPPGLVLLREGLEQALGLSFQGRRGNYFFRATLVQTLFYGVFSAWVLWARKNPLGHFDWRGVVCYISNYSWISEPSFVVLRQHLLHSFDKFWIENLHGNRKISEYAPDGRTSETVFAIPGFSVGIQQGVVTSLWVKTGEPKSVEQPATVLLRNDIDAARAVERRQQLLESLEQPHFNEHYQKTKPAKTNRFSLRPSDVADHYQEWPKVTEFCAEPPSNGLMEKRGGALIAIDRNSLEERMKAYFDPSVKWATLIVANTGLTRDAARFNAEKTRKKIQAKESYDSERLQPYAIRPFDIRWCYYSSVRPLWNEPRPRYWEQCWQGNEFFMTRFRSTASPEGIACFWVKGLSDDHFITPDNACFPIRLRCQSTAGNSKKGTIDMFGSGAEPVIIANLSKPARAYLQHLKFPNPDQDPDTAALIWLHALAIGYSPAYLSENADGIHQDWPHVPLPAERDVLEASAALGRQVATLLDTETPVSSVTKGNIRPDLKPIAIIARVGGGTLNPGAGELALTAG